jgi:hypothetical protein
VAASGLKAGDFLLDSDLQEVEIEKVESVVLAEPIAVYNFEVEGNHNYFVVPSGGMPSSEPVQTGTEASFPGILVHNAGGEYGEKEVVLKGQAISILETNGFYKNPETGVVTISGHVTDTPITEKVANRNNQMQAMERTLDDLIEITSNDPRLNASVKEFAIKRLEMNKKIVSERRALEQRDFVYGRVSERYTQAETDAILRQLMFGKDSNLSEFENLVKLGHGGSYTVKELERDKIILQYLLGGEYAIQRTSSNPLLWLAKPLTSNANWMVEQVYKVGGLPGEAVLGGVAGAIGTAGGVTVGSAVTGFTIGGAFGLPVEGAAIGGLIGAFGAFGAFGGGLFVKGELDRLKNYQEAISKDLPRAEKDKIIKLPSELDYTKPLIGKPDFKEGNDLTDWFMNALEVQRQSGEFEYLQKHKATKEQWALYLELFRTKGSWDLKEYISPYAKSNKGLGAHGTYEFAGVKLPQDLFGNVFIGYSTQQMGMSLNSAQLGAGIFQIRDHIANDIADVNSIGDRGVFRDDSIDNFAIEVGYELASLCGSRCQPQDFARAFEQVAKKVQEGK